MRSIVKSKLFVAGLFILILSSVGISLAIASYESSQPAKTTMSSMMSIYGMNHYS